MKRPFNKIAYDKFDLKCKEELVNMMVRKGYNLVGDLKEEHYKLYDVKFEKNGEEISFENETRPNFIRIRDIFDTIHIPLRKKNTMADYYVVWKPEFDEFILIEKSVIEEYAKNVVSINCIEYSENDDIEVYHDSFIDIPKNRAKLYKKMKNVWRCVDKK
jgi:hypothetical protein